MRIKTQLPIVLAGVALLLAIGPAWAHHTLIVEYAVSNPITLRGTITKLEWKNPHGWIYLDVKRANGRIEKWAIETGSPYQMEKRGLTKFDLWPGVEIIVGAFRAKNGTRTAAGWVVTFLDREASALEDEEGAGATFSLGR